MRKFRTQKKSGEVLAIDHRADIFDLLAMPVTPNEERDGCVIVSIIGPLEHRSSPFGDSYETIRARFGEALESDTGVIVLRIDSPGGVVSGLNQTVFDMRRAAKAKGVQVVAYVDELACSAAYAIACVADEIVIPPSGVAGSIGVRSEILDQTKADAKAGVAWHIVTSGERKADGDPRLETTDVTLEREQGRVDELASQFFDVVSEARGLTVDAIRSYQAGTFLGADAVAAGLADDLMGWEELLAALADVGPGASSPQKPIAPRGESVPRSLAHPGTTATGTNMRKIKALIAKAKLSLKTEKNAEERKRLKLAITKHEALLAADLPPNVLASSLTAMKKTKYKLEEETTEEDDEAEDADDMPGDEPKKKDDDAEDCEDDADAESDDDDAEASDDDGDADAEDDDPKKDAKAGKAAAIAAKASRTEKLEREIAQLRSKEEQREKDAAIDAAFAARRISRADARDLKTKKMAFVKEFLAMHKRPIVQVEGEEDRPNIGSLDEPVTKAGISDTQMRYFQQAVAASNGTLKLEKLIADYRANPHQMNGLGKVG